MRAVSGFLSVFLAVIFVLPTWGNWAYPCCHVTQLRAEHLLALENISDIYLVSNKTCDGFSLASLNSAKNGTSQLVISRCGNGLNVVSFFIAVLQRSSSALTVQLRELLNTLESIYASFSVEDLFGANLNRYAWRHAG
ncbi:BKRF2 [Macacine gammaherpesvirus 4]|uniref:BKRF2 n=1 Tax=Macacine gammaherpesvirus 4 TaxID=45455 RepID=Q8UZH0_9GAMA|nr:BKRF2 [Macacine gammaherpesvirus 4]AAK95441.1 BKRF2 [Macacine gammaherpesvirus 4]